MDLSFRLKKYCKLKVMHAIKHLQDYMKMHEFWNFWYLGWVYVNTFYPIHKFHFMSCKPTINSLQWLWLWFVKAYASKNLSNIQNLCIIPFNWILDVNLQKDTANWMLCIHWKASMNVVQNAPTVNLLHFGYQYCGK